ncbi:RNA polymerase sigma-70 factor [Hymenobacter koreensis]|uniref:RNA polymerase sigma-70 factor n=2 Tax=Hymenobacter koreensis TaxID=1084523 RepID=A0ABP8IX43_9BACT
MLRFSPRAEGFRRLPAHPAVMPEVATLDALEIRLAELQRTDGEAFMQALFKGYYRPLGNVIFRVVQDRDVAEDLLQDVFLRVWNNRDTLVISSTYKAYLYRAAMNAALRHTERSKRQVAWDDANVAEPSANTTDEGLNGHEAEQAVAEALETLPPQCRAVFLMSRQEGLSYQQIAEALDVAPKTVENQMGKALRLLRQQLSGFFSGLTMWVLVWLGW